jgi:protein translocase SecG subunit
MNNILVISQTIVAVILIVFILLQQRGEALGSAFGGTGGGFYGTRRGIQQKLFWATIVVGALFIILALLNLLL